MKSGNRGHLFILSGPAGVGKGTLRKKLFQRVPGLVFSISCTTRPVRPGEVDGRDYCFMGKDEFGRMIINGEFLEWAEVHGKYYGTKVSDVRTCLDFGCDMVLEIDVQGSSQIRDKVPDAIAIFITVSSLDELEKRLRGRGTESDEQIMLRLRNAAVEMSRSGEYDHVIVNDDVERAAEELVEIVKSYRNRE